MLPMRILSILKLTALAVACAFVPQNACAQDTISTSKDWGVFNVSACNLRSTGDYDAGMESQGLMGMPLRIVQRQSWWQVETPEGYHAWVHPTSVTEMTRDELTAWNNGPLVVVTTLYGFIYSEPNTRSTTISDIVASNRLKLLGTKGNFFHVQTPDGRQGYVLRSEADELQHWRKGLKNSTQDILNTAHTLMGIPYMWGGTSTKGVDCSGFVRTTLLQHDIIIPRNASQMAIEGTHIDIAPDYSNLQPGDLLFFGTKATEDKPARVSHVGFYTGNGRFIHSLGRVREASFIPTDADYDAYNLGRLLWAQRILPFVNKQPNLMTTDKNSFYK